LAVSRYSLIKAILGSADGIPTTDGIPTNRDPGESRDLRSSVVLR
jgi:hypothetical protein